MHSIQELQQKITDTFATENFLFEPAALYEPIVYALAQGGKRIRPLLVLMSCDLFGGDVEEALKPSVGVELFHNFTLLHDDIMDNAPIRRGRPSVFRKWNSNVAILSGDTMFVMAYDYICQVREKVLPQTVALFNDTARKVCEGQQYDMDFETQNDVSIDDYLKMIRLKTAVLLACSVKLGAILAGAGEKETDKIYEFGDQLGMAFQLQDDFLDIYGDTTKFGKEIGGDIATNKKTFLYLKAFEEARGDDLVRLASFFRDRDHDNDTKVARIKEMYTKLGVDHMTRELVETYLSRALKCLTELNIPGERKSGLRRIALEMLNREA
jgi:geranylgeranyl diphosphate synthase, type II